MIVYGDTKFHCSLKTSLSHLHNRLKHIGNNIDDIRTVLIISGQIEQGIFDYLDIHPYSSLHDAATEIKNTTDILAEWFVEKYYGSTIIVKPNISDLLNTASHDISLKIVTPEGYSQYSLFPEQYIDAAQKWHNEQSDLSRILITGIRSIGTSLSAVVKATLKRHGHDVYRFTVRPIGDAFARESDIPEYVRECTKISWCFAVDEGPGLSGTSLASIAQAYHSAGADIDHIVFFPGHLGEPGPRCPRWARKWWRTIKRYHADISEICWGGNTLTDVLKNDFNTEAGIIDISQGKWRSQVYSSPVHWPPAASAFERNKYKIGSIFWKFAGFAAEDENWHTGEELAFQQQKRLSSLSHTVPVIYTRRGFIALPWVDGEVPSKQLIDESRIETVIKYICSAASDIMTNDEQREAIDRLLFMTYWNCQKKLGNEAALKLSNTVQKDITDTRQQPIFAYGDGHMAPWEWRITHENQCIKLDVTGNINNHTYIGKQSILWDLAGFSVEWMLDEIQVAQFIEFYNHHTKSNITYNLLSAYRIAYSAYRMGMCVFCMNNDISDAEEWRRYERLLPNYTDILYSALRPYPAERAITIST